MAGQLIGPYEIRDELGRGGMGVVYRAYDTSTDREVALKVLPMRLSGEPGFLDRFLNEGKVIARLEHPHILPLYAVGEEDGQPYIAMRLVRGGTLDDRIEAGQVTPEQLGQIVTQVAAALDVAHAQGVLHRDIKPGNILLDEHENAYLADFGIAKMLEGTVNFTAEGGLVGTPAYMAPEQWRGEGIDARTDVYALGCVVYQALTGDLPYEATGPAAFMTRHIHDPIPSIREKRPELPSALDDLLQTALAKEPGDRPASAGAFAQAFSQTLRALDDGLLTLPAITVMGKESRKSSGGRLVPIAAGGILLVVAVVLAVLFVPGLMRSDGTDGETEQVVSQSDGTAPAAVPTPILFPVAGLREHVGRVEALALSPDETLLASTGQDGKVVIWDHVQRSVAQKLTGDDIWLLSISWSPDGSEIAAGAIDGNIPIWDVTTGEQVRVIQGDGGPVSSVAWSPDGTLIASANDGPDVTVWNSQTGSVIRRLEGHSDTVNEVAWNGDGSLLASASQDGSVIIWNPGGGGAVQTLSDHDAPVTSLYWHRGRASSHEWLATGGVDMRIYHYRTQGSQIMLTYELTIHTAPIEVVRPFPSPGTLFVSGDSSGTIQVVSQTSAEFGVPAATIEVQTGAVHDTAWLTGTDTLAVAQDEGLITLFDIEAEFGF